MRPTITAIAATLTLSGCGSDPISSSEPDDPAPPASMSDARGSDEHLSEAVFDPERLLDVRIELDEADWDVLKNEGRHIADLFTELACPDGPALYEYTRFPATVTIDGETVENVGIRKKGFLGSLSAVRPSLKLKFDFYEPRQRFSGMQRMTLNNNRQDPSNVHQCLTYGLFEKAERIAPRCNHARVHVNGEDLGIYTHVESIKKPFLRRHFADDTGNLYEGQTADFTSDLAKIFEYKTNVLTNDGSDVERVIDALGRDDAEVVAALENVVDIEVFLDLWILESISAHWDSYSGNANNYYAYHDPTSDLFYIIPWGADGAFEPRGVTGRPRHASVQARGAIANRLYEVPTFRERYVSRLREMLDTTWDEEEMLGEIDRVLAIIPSDIEVDGDAVAEVRSVIRDRRAAIEAEIASGPLDEAFSTRSSQCVTLVPDPVSGSFGVEWGELSNSAPPSSPATGTLNVALGGAPLELTVVSGQAGIGSDLGTPSPQIRIIATDPTGKLYIVMLSIEPTLFAAGADVPFHGVETMGIVVALSGDVAGTPEPLGMISKGSIVLEQAGTQAGERVSGSFSGVFTFGAPG